MFPRSRRRLFHAALALLAALLATGCWESYSRNQVASAGGRFRHFESASHAGEGLLLDAATGDVWQLEGSRAEGARWVLLARGPEDARPIPAESLLGLPAAE